MVDELWSIGSWNDIKSHVAKIGKEKKWTIVNSPKLGNGFGGQGAPMILKGDKIDGSTTWPKRPPGSLGVGPGSGNGIKLTIIFFWPCD